MQDGRVIEFFAACLGRTGKPTRASTLSIGTLGTAQWQAVT
jgi:hypothetical protein